MRVGAALISALLVSPVLAQDDHDHGVAPELSGEPHYDPALLDECLENARGYGEKHTCIGIGAEACAAAGGGSSTAGLGFCYSSEWEHWDARLNAAYQRLLITQADVAEDNAAFNPNIPNAVDLLRDMQRDWIAFRDNACDWERVQWGGGTGGGPATGACLMGLTAQQTLFLEERLY